MATKYKRTRLWIDPGFQSRLLLRLGLYLLLYTAVGLHIGFAFDLVLNYNTRPFGKGFVGAYLEFIALQKPLLCALVIITPVVLYDMVQFSHRVAGPLYRCRKVMQEMASGKRVPEFKPRRHDLMQELFQAFNALIKEWNAKAGDTSGSLQEENATREEAKLMNSAPGSTAVPKPQRLAV
jgi:hypothetical protein